MMNRSESRVLDLPLLPEPERDQLLFEWNATSRPYPADCCIHQVFESQAETTPDRVAVIFDGRHLSYRELNSRANQLAGHLRGLGIEAEQRVAVYLDRSLEMLIGIVAILKSGGAYVPIDPHYPLERVSYLLEDSRAPVIVTRKDLSEELPHHWAHAICLDSDWEEIAREGRQNPGCTTVFGNIAYIIYTSGSTGIPKGVLITHRGLVNSTAARFDYYNPADKFALLSSFSFDSSVAGIFWTICQGGALLLPREGAQKDPLQVVSLISQERVSHLLTVPSYYTQLLAQAGPSDFESLDTVIIAGESWPKELVERHMELNPHARIYNEYGPTEGTVWSSVYKAGGGEYRASVPIGSPIANVRVYLLDPHLKPVPVGAPGQIHLGGEGLARGYFNHPELTASKFAPDPLGARAGERLYCTGDLARYLPDGNVEFLGRSDQQVKIRGYRIELEEIEAVLMRFSAVCQAVVVAREDSSGARRLVAYIVMDGSDEPAAGEFRSFLEQRLPAYMIPSVFVCLETLPLTPNGKVDRRALPALDQSRPRLESDFVEPGTEVERSLAEIWTKVLHIDRIGLNDNFFELGLDSILSIQILSKARERGLNLSLQQIFNHQTIGRLAQVLSDQLVDASSSWRTKPFDLVSEQDRLSLSDGVEDAYPLSMLQAGMIFHSELSRDSAAYHSINSARLRGPLDLGALRTAAQRVIDRHALFRTSFHLSGFSEPLQLVHRTAEVVMGVDDLRSLSADEKEGALAAWLEAEQLRRFDWVSPPLLRLHIHRWADDEFQFTFTAHHGVIDGWSDSLFLTELFRLYLSFLHGWVEPPEPPPASTFRDYIALERESLRSGECRRYWADKLADCTVTTLPREPRLEETPDQVPFHRLDLAVPDQVSDGLKELAASVGVPLKSVLLAAHLRIMSLLSGHDDVITGLVSNGRSEATDGDRVIGLFLNTLPFRQELRGGRWNELIKQTFENETELLPYRRYPLAQIQRDMGGQPLFETCFNYVHFHLFKSIQESREIEVLSTNAVAETNYPLIAHFAFAPSSTGLRVALDCDLRELSLDQIERIGGYYMATLGAMVSAPNGHYETCSLLSPQERRQLISEWNETEANFPLKSRLSELFERQARLSPSSIAVSCEGQSLTYAELNRRANRVARGLVGEGVGADFVVALLAERGLDLLTSILGVFKAGGAYLPLDPLHPEGRIHQVLRQSGARQVLTSSQFQSSLSGMLEGIPSSERPRLLVMEQLYRTDLPDADLPVRSKAADLAYVIFTSGSTGLPKGAMIEQAGMINHLFAKISALGLSADDVVAQTASQCFDISVWQFLAALLVGGSVRIFKDDVSHDGLRLLDEVESHGVTILETVPSLLTAILDETAVGEPPRDLPRLRWMIPTGEALPPELCRAWLKRYPHIPMLNAYGPTECSDDVTHHTICEPPGPDVKSVPIGRPLANTRIYIVDQRLSPVPRGVIGELCVGGVGVGRGYINDEAQTREVFIEDPFAAAPGGRLYKTGDLARYLPDGSIEFHGRLDHQVKIRGFRIELEEIEEAIRREAGVKEVAVVAREDAAEKRLVGYIVWDGEQQITTAELRKRLSQRLPEYMAPSAFMTLEALPLTTNGKINRQALPEPEPSQPLSGYVSPRTETEELLAGVWAGVLGIERVGIDDNFFEIGGHSLLATQAISKVRQAFLIDLPLRSLFEHPTISGLSKHVDQMKRESAGPPPPPAAPITP
jgi:amino acid adenylation domain-containing protein